MSKPTEQMSLAELNIEIQRYKNTLGLFGSFVASNKMQVVMFCDDEAECRMQITRFERQREQLIAEEIRARSFERTRHADLITIASEIDEYNLPELVAIAALLKGHGYSTGHLFRKIMKIFLETGPLVDTLRKIEIVVAKKDYIVNYPTMHPNTPKENEKNLDELSEEMRELNITLDDIIATLTSSLKQPEQQLETKSS